MIKASPDLYETLIFTRPVTNGPLTAIGATSITVRASRENAVTDLIYLAAGVAVLLLFAAYAALLKRA
jgi:hypothetical protein